MTAFLRCGISLALVLCVVPVVRAQPPAQTTQPSPAPAPAAGSSAEALAPPPPAGAAQPTPAAVAAPPPAGAPVTATRAAPSAPTHRFSLTFSPLHLILPVVEVTGEIALGRKGGLAIIAGGGS